MDLLEFQNEILSFVSEKNLGTTIEIRMIDLISEIGELSKEILKSSNYGKEEFKNTDNLLVEFGDVLFSLICVANSANIDLEKSLNCALSKYKRRFEDNGRIESEK